MTRNDFYDLLTFEGVHRGFRVLAEFHVDVPPEHRVYECKLKKVDLVWATRRSDCTHVQDSANPDHWRIWAAFEIEGCNVGRKEFCKDVAGFRALQNLPGEDAPLCFMLLYTAAWDRRDRVWNNRAQTRCLEEIQQRQRWASSLGDNAHGQLFQILDRTNTSAAIEPLRRGRIG